MVGGASDDVLSALTRYGEAVGLAFQIHDDVLDAGQDGDADGPPSFVKLAGLEGAGRLAHEQADVAVREAESVGGTMLVAIARFTVARAASSWTTSPATSRRRRLEPTSACVSGSSRCPSSRAGG
jgi:geranylgeranyl pyrophosphate synthase